MSAWLNEVNPRWIFGIAGALVAGWGAIVAIYNDWATRLMKRVQRIYGRWAADQVTPSRTRFIGVCLVIGGLAFVVMSILGIIPSHS